MDTQAMLAQVSKIEREKAQAELLVQQLGQAKTELAAECADLSKKLGRPVTPENLADIIAELKKSVTDALKAAGGAPVDAIDELSI